MLSKVNILKYCSLLRSTSNLRYNFKSYNTLPCYNFSTEQENQPQEREQMKYDVLIVGGGPAGLSAAIQLKKLEKKYDKPINVCLIEKGSEIGSHILSGCILETRAFDELYPKWRSMDNKPPISTPVTNDRMMFLYNQNKHFEFPKMMMPPLIANDKGNYVISLGDLCKWLGAKATEAGVEIFPGFAGNEILTNGQGQVKGVATGDFGIGKDGSKKDSYARGVELIAKQTIFAEGARGSLSERVMKQFKLRENSDPQVYGLGVKEVWEVPQAKFQSGQVLHTVGWPLDFTTYGGGFIYSLNPNLVHIGIVVGLGYKNPHINIYEEFQKLKTHKKIREIIEGGSCISYGARVLNEGGFFALPKLTFPGGVLAGCSAGFLNPMKIKGTHLAMKTGMLAADSIYQKLILDENNSEGQEISEYQKTIEKSWVWSEMHQSRNFHNTFKYTVFGGLMYGGFNSLVSKGKEPFDLRSNHSDSSETQEKTKFKTINYPKHDGKLTFDLLDNLIKSGTNHQHDQPSHLKIKSGKETSSQKSLKEYAGIEEKFCPAKVYEFQPNEKGEPQLVINAQNCVHCKACSIKMVDEYIDWNVPEGGGGPNYSGM